MNFLKFNFYLVLTSVFIVQEAAAQCNPATIYSNDTTHAVCFEILGNIRKCYSNNIPNHTYGPFGGGNTIQGQDFDYSMCLYPEMGLSSTELTVDTNSQGCGNGIIFGISMHGVNYSPFARIYWVDTSTLQENLAWNVEADFILNMDINGGHINNISRYHYHNIASDYFLNDLNINGTSHSPIVGYAADGFPIYYKYLYTNPTNPGAGLSAFQSSYALKSGNRPGNGISAPNGPYDGEYIQDYEYIAAQSVLDECGGRFGITPDYPTGTYYYVLTDNWPYIPRCLNGKFVDNSFKLGPNCPISTAGIDCSFATPLKSIEDLEVEVTVFPNPSSSFISIELNGLFDEDEVTSVKIYSTDAKMIYYSEVLEDKINLSQIEKGIYFIQLDLKQGQFTKKIKIQ